MEKILYCVAVALVSVSTVTPLNSMVCDQLNIKRTCSLPKCYCHANQIPGGLAPEVTPRMVLIAYSGHVDNSIRKKLISIVPASYKNHNNCPVSITIFPTNVSTDYCAVHKLYLRGHEIGTNSLNGTSPNGAANVDWREKFSVHKELLAAKGHLPEDHVTGARAPGFNLGGDDQFAAIYDGKFSYDASIQIDPTNKEYLWPFTLDVPVEDLLGGCHQLKCPRNTSHGLWEIPTVPLRRGQQPCYTLDECVHTKSGENQIADLLSYNLMARNNRAPMVINFNPKGLNKDAALEGLRIFIERHLREKDVWFVTMSELLAWVRNPVPLKDLPQFAPWDCEERLYFMGCDLKCRNNNGNTESEKNKKISLKAAAFLPEELWKYEVALLVISYIIILYMDRRQS